MNGSGPQGGGTAFAVVPEVLTWPQRQSEDDSVSSRAARTSTSPEAGNLSMQPATGHPARVRVRGVWLLWLATLVALVGCTQAQPTERQPAYGEDEGKTAINMLESARVFPESAHQFYRKFKAGYLRSDYPYIWTNVFIASGLNPDAIEDHLELLCWLVDQGESEDRLGSMVVVKAKGELRSFLGWLRARQQPGSTETLASLWESALSDVESFEFGGGVRVLVKE